MRDGPSGAQPTLAPQAPLGAGWRGRRPVPLLVKQSVFACRFGSATGKAWAALRPPTGATAHALQKLLDLTPRRFATSPAGHLRMGLRWPLGRGCNLPTQRSSI